MKERSKLTKIFCKSGQRKTDQENVMGKATAECINEILQAKKNPAIPPLFVDGISFFRFLSE